jgi:hypothetical protein
MRSRWIKALGLVPLFVVVALTSAAQEADRPSGPTCKDNGECDRSQYCQKRSGQCNGQGRCVVRPQVCPLIFDPVCGCDGVTYSNSCIAASTGVNVKSQGECPTNCTQNSDCRVEGQYCAKRTGACKGKGMCTPRPEICPEIEDPVCGCDGKTYGNACKAAAAGVNVTSLGECKKA